MTVSRSLLAGFIALVLAGTVRVTPAQEVTTTYAVVVVCNPTSGDPQGTRATA